MSQAYAFINDQMQGDNTLKARSGGGSDKFNILNVHIRNQVVMPGQMVAGGLAGAYLTGSLCAAIAIPTGGMGGLACGILVGVAGGYAGGKIGEKTGEMVGEKLYEWRPEP